jgi:hypothetical protein
MRFDGNGFYNIIIFITYNIMGHFISFMGLVSNNVGMVILDIKLVANHWYFNSLTKM